MGTSTDADRESDSESAADSDADAAGGADDTADAAVRTGLRINVFRSLKHGGVCLRAVEGAAAGAVVDRRESTFVRDAEFVVDQEKRRKALATGERTVHAWVRGTLVEDPEPPGKTVPVVYDPRAYSSFVLRSTEEAIRRARVAQVRPDCVLAVP
jgi:hypothetical protein